MATARVNLWGRTIGYLRDLGNGFCGFQYDREFLNSGIELSPIVMPLAEKTYSFLSLRQETFHGLPGMFADSLPDKFGNRVIEKYLSEKGETLSDISPVERLCFTGTRGMGALEYEPEATKVIDESLDIDILKNIANDILSKRESTVSDEKHMLQLFQGSSSVGGARAKTLVAYNEKTHEFRSGQINAGDGFDYWLLKFDGINNNTDKDTVPDRQGYTNIEYAYYLMAVDCGINMTECRLYENNKLLHFMTRRFDREYGRYGKIHMQTLGALAHFDFNDPDANSYENAFSILRKLNLPYTDFTELFRRMVFNVFMVNCDDHVKNISFLMNRSGKWSLSPAYDMTFSYRPDSIWLNSHQMSINGKKDNITVEDLLAVAKYEDIKNSDASDIIEKIREVNGKWYLYSERSLISNTVSDTIQSVFDNKNPCV